jgi:hypothetical protein
MLVLIAVRAVGRALERSQLTNHWNRVWALVDILRKSGRLSGNIRFANRVAKLTITKELNRKGREAAFAEVDTLAFLYSSEICRWACNAVLQRYAAKVETIEFSHHQDAGFGISIRFGTTSLYLDPIHFQVFRKDRDPLQDFNCRLELDHQDSEKSKRTAITGVMEWLESARQS